MVTKVGMLNKIRLINDSPMMVRFTLTASRRDYSCITVNSALIVPLLMLPNEKYNISVDGHFNKKKQLIVSNFSIQNPDKMAHELGF